MTLNVFIINLLNGISFGSVLFIMASGLSITFGLMGILNLSHGALYMIGGYIGWTIAVQYGLNFELAALIGGLVAGAVGLFIEHGFLRHLYKQPNEQALLTFGFVYILTNLCLWIWGPLARPAFTARFLSGSFPIGHWSYPIVRADIIITGLVLAAGLWWLQDKTRVGAIVRAGMDDKEMTMGLGVNLERVSVTLFFIGSFLAGFAGVIGAQFLGINLQFGINILLLALAVIVVGGIGSVEGTLLGSMLIGIIDTFGKALFPGIAMFLIYFTMIVILLFKPVGLIGKVQKR